MILINYISYTNLKNLDLNKFLKEKNKLKNQIKTYLISMKKIYLKKNKKFKRNLNK